eukprot:878906-Pyramimonas_sp.AAC.1
MRTHLSLEARREACQRKEAPRLLALRRRARGPPEQGQPRLRAAVEALRGLRLHGRERRDRARRRVGS